MRQMHMPDWHWLVACQSIAGMKKNWKVFAWMKTIRRTVLTQKKLSSWQKQRAITDIILHDFKESNKNLCLHGLHQNIEVFITAAGSENAFHFLHFTFIFKHMGLFPHSFIFQMDILYISWQLSHLRKEKNKSAQTPSYKESVCKS